MRTTQAVITLVLAMSVGAITGVAQVVTDKPAVGTADKLRERLQDAQVKVLVPSSY